MAHRREVSRIEGFSDAMFAFAITLLVVSLEVPKSFDELLGAIRGFPAFAICFAMLFQVWRRHYKFFRAYDLEDGTVIGLTGVLLFVVLFYVYPLKFLWSVVFAQFGWGPPRQEMLTPDRMAALFEIYGLGVSATFAILAAMYGHAYRRRTALELTPAEIIETRMQIYSNLGLAAVGLTSVAVAFITGRLSPRLIGLAGYVYFLIGFVEWGLGEYKARLQRRLRAVTDTAGTLRA
jgi:Endosomal/lysosomal potassium channel TMEM175